MSEGTSIEEHVEQIDALQTSYDAFKYLKKLSNEAGFGTFSVLSFQKNSDEIASLSVVNNWNPELIQVYDGEKLAVQSPILEHCKLSVRPLSYNLDVLSQNRIEAKKRLSVELFNDFEMKHGLCLPVQNSSGVKGSVSLSGDRLMLAGDDRFNVHILAGYLFDKMTNTEAVPAANAPQLSDRERDCLNWTAAGKTSSEIACILQLSDHTINHYLTSAARKLDAVNRVQAVAKAIRLQLLN